MSVIKDRIDDRDPAQIADGCIDEVDRRLNPLGRFHRHNYMHAGTIPMVFDEFGRCAYCVKNGQWTPDA
jgi:hypothetical protein